MNKNDDRKAQLRVMGAVAVLAAGVDTIMLDNFSPAELRAGVELVAGRAVVEASGGVSLETIGAIAATGVDVISVGALTHTVRSLDLGLDAVVEGATHRMATMQARMPVPRPAATAPAQGADTGLSPQIAALHDRQAATLEAMQMRLAEAHERLAAGGVRGRLVLDFD